MGGKKLVMLKNVFFKTFAVVIVRWFWFIIWYGWVS